MKFNKKYISKFLPGPLCSKKNSNCWTIHYSTNQHLCNLTKEVIQLTNLVNYPLAIEKYVLDL